MMLNIKFAEFKGRINVDMTFAFFIASILFADLVVVIICGTRIIIPIGNTEFAISSNIGNAYEIGKCTMH